MTKSPRSRLTIGLALFCATVTLFAAGANAQGPQFSYQGTINSGGSPASGPHDFEFRLFDAASGGSQVGSAEIRNGLNVVNGGFSVVLDFGSASFPGSDRFLEVAVRPSSGGAFTPLAPRSRILSTPYSITSGTAGTATNALNLGGSAANLFVLTGDARLSNARVPTPGSSDYIQNNSGTPQANANLNIDGTATATNVNASQHYRLNGQRVLFTTGAPVDSIFVGPNIALNSTGVNNTFFGVNAGTLNTTGAGNTFFGRNAGNNNLGGQSNVFVGNGSGGGNQAGSFNVYVGQIAGNNAAAGQANTYIGTNAGASVASGANTNNVAVGADAGNAASLGSNNTFIGKGAIPNQPNLSFATAIGSGAVVGTSNTIVIGRSSDTTIFPGAVQINGGVSGATIAVCATAVGGRLGACGANPEIEAQRAAIAKQQSEIDDLKATVKALQEQIRRRN